MLTVQDPGHSISFGWINTWSDLHLFPTKRPFVAPPEPILKMDEVDGMDGVLDYSLQLQSFLNYKDREGSWEFRFIDDDENYTWKDCWRDLYYNVNNQYFNKIILEDDPYYYYYGRVYIENFNNNQSTTTVSIRYRLYPFKQRNVNSTRWLWNDLLLLDEIDYGRVKLSSNRSKKVTLTNNMTKEVSIDAKTDHAVTVSIPRNDGTNLSDIYTINKGITKSAFKLKSGETTITIKFYNYYSSNDEGKTFNIYFDYPMTIKKNETRNFDWNWDDLFNINKIYYGRFSVNGTKRRVLLKNSNEDTSVSFYCNNSFTLKVDGDSTEYELVQGYNENVITLENAGTVIDISGTGEVIINYVIGGKG